MNVIHVVPSLDTGYGGPAVSVPSLALAMREFGYDPIFVSVDAPSAINPIIMEVGLPWYRASPAGLPVGFASLNLQRILDRVALENAVSIIHVHSVWGHPTVAAYKAARRASASLVISPRSELYPISVQKNRLLKSLFRKYFVQEVLDDAQLLHVTDEKEKLAAQEYVDPSKIFLASNGVDLSIGAQLDVKSVAKQKLGLDPEARTILYLARLHPRKNPDVLLRAWLEGGFAQRGWNLLMAGDSYNDGYIQSLNASVPEEFRGTLHWLGHVGGEMKRAVLAAADIFCLPSEFENFGIAIAEALACGVPVVTTDGTPWGELQAKNAGRIVKVGDSRALASALSELADIPEHERLALGERGRVVVQRFTWESSAKLMARAYSEHCVAAKPRKAGSV